MDDINWYKNHVAPLATMKTSPKNYRLAALDVIVETARFALGGKTVRETAEFSHNLLLKKAADIRASLPNSDQIYLSGVSYGIIACLVEWVPVLRIDARDDVIPLIPTLYTAKGDTLVSNFDSKSCDLCDARLVFITNQAYYEQEKLAA